MIDIREHGGAYGGGSRTVPFHKSKSGVPINVLPLTNTIQSASEMKSIIFQKDDVYYAVLSNDTVHFIPTKATHMDSNKVMDFNTSRGTMSGVFTNASLGAPREAIYYKPSNEVIVIYGKGVRWYDGTNYTLKSELNFYLGGSEIGTTPIRIINDKIYTIGRISSNTISYATISIGSKSLISEYPLNNFPIGMSYLYNFAPLSQTEVIFTGYIYPGPKIYKYVLSGGAMVLNSESNLPSEASVFAEASATKNVIFNRDGYFLLVGRVRSTERLAFLEVSISNISIQSVKTIVSEYANPSVVVYGDNNYLTCYSAANTCVVIDINNFTVLFKRFESTSVSNIYYVGGHLYILSRDPQETTQKPALLNLYVKE